MSEEIKQGSAADQAGSSAEVAENIVDPNKLGDAEGQSTSKDASQENKGGDIVSTEEHEKLKTQHSNLETKIGEQGNELGEYKKFFDETSPLLEKLDKDPNLVEAIMSGKITGELIDSVASGEVSKKDAETITEAHKEVKKEAGKAYEGMTPEQINQLISDKVKEGLDEAKVETNKKISDSEALREFDISIRDFVGSTPDFEEYLPAITKWIEENPDQDNIEIAYKVVKGEALNKAETDRVAKDEGEANKDVVANAGGGASQGGAIKAGADVADQLIGGTSNPNVF